MPLLGKLFSSLFRPSVAQPPHLSLESMERELHALSEQAQARRRADDPAQQPPAQVEAAAREEQWKDEAESARRRLAGDIARLHETLQTGVTPSRLDRLSRLLRAHLTPPAASRPVEERTDHHVLSFLYDRAGELAWEELEKRMAAVGLDWPLPPETAAGRTAQELEVARSEHRKQVHDWFIGTSPLLAADLIHGRVPAWGLAHPQEGGALWCEVSLRAVGEALRAQLLAAGLELWQWRPPDLDERLRGLLAEALDRARRDASTGAPPERYERDWWNRMPRMVWDYVAPRLQDGDGDVAVLADGVQQVDPVCGMALTVDRVAERLVSGGRTYYFCNGSCREQFERSLDKVEASHPS